MFGLGASCGATAALSSSTPRDPAMGTVSGQAWIADRGASGAVDVFNATGRLVARHRCARARCHFNFVLKPGRYEVELKMTPPSFIWAGCQKYSKKTVRVRASRAAHVLLSQGCENTY